MIKKNSDDQDVSMDNLDRGGRILYKNIRGAIEDDAEEDILTFNKMENDTTVKLIGLELLEDAPTKWNFFTPLIDSRFQSMKNSIMEYGLFHPILVWEIKDGTKYMILSGHNRKRAFEELFQDTGDNKYTKISAKVLRSNKMSEQKARGIVSMANYAQINVNPTEKFKALKSIFIYNQEELNIKKKADNYKLIEENTGKDLSTIKRILNLGRLIPELLDMVGGDKPISLKAAQRLVTLNVEDQRWLYDNYKDKLNSKNVSKIRRLMERDTIKELFIEKEVKEVAGVNIFIPKSLEVDIKKLIKEWEKINNISWE